MALFASRYARALADVVGEYKLDPNAVETQLNSFLKTWDQSSELREVFEDPSVPSVQKIAALDGMQASFQLQPQVRNLLAVLIANDRIAHVREVVSDYLVEVQSRMGVHQAEVTSARPLQAADKAQLLEQVAKLADGEVVATFREDAAILGGVVVRIGSTVYDGSVRGRVERLKEELMK